RATSTPPPTSAEQRARFRGAAPFQRGARYSPAAPDPRCRARRSRASCPTGRALALAAAQSRRVAARGLLARKPLMARGTARRRARLGRACHWRSARGRCHRSPRFTLGVRRWRDATVYAALPRGLRPHLVRAALLGPVGGAAPDVPARAL